ncbi:amino acid ABC transporter permease [Paracoccus suum]|uniref:Amino acid ABC transporter permease n=1 Tax=Paracoccus suum TaxID=2259340 RepID=A0A344PLD3_9RHOB|nr:amino acid ABC transporter permease [Paracoccus suum]AXC50188.1 amino acid ABC transporter permease [Paracoccus suum]
MNEIILNFFNLEILREVAPLLVQGFWMTLKLSVVSIPLAAALGLALAITQGASGRIGRTLVIAYVDVFRSIPPLVLLIFIFYALPFLGLRLTEFPAAILALVLNGASYFAEIFRAGLESVPKGQHEAARSTGLGWRQSMQYVIIPQGTRNVMPDLVSNTLELAKQTSIASAVALQELLRSAQLAQGMTYNATPLIAAAVVYFLLFWPFVRLVSRLHQTSGSGAG